MTSLYDDLDVPPDATPEDLKRAHRRAAKKHHPDAGGDPEAFARVQRAITVLRDPTKRAQYDRDGTAEDQPDNQLAELTETLGSAFREAVTACPDLKRFDVVDGMRRVLLNRIEAIKESRRLLLEQQRETAEMMVRLGYTGKETNVLAAILNERQANIGRELAEHERIEALTKRGLDMAGNYSWKVDAEPQVQMWGFSTATAGTTIG